MKTEFYYFCFLFVFLQTVNIKPKPKDNCCKKPETATNTAQTRNFRRFYFRHRIYMENSR